MEDFVRQLLLSTVVFLVVFLGGCFIITSGGPGSSLFYPTGNTQAETPVNNAPAEAAVKKRGYVLWFETAPKLAAKAQTAAPTTSNPNLWFATPR